MTWTRPGKIIWTASTRPTWSSLAHIPSAVIPCTWCITATPVLRGRLPNHTHPTRTCWTTWTAWPVWMDLALWNPMIPTTGACPLPPSRLVSLRPGLAKSRSTMQVRISFFFFIKKHGRARIVRYQT